MVLFTSPILSQELNQHKKNGFSFGINFGAHFANKKTAQIYSGTPAQTDYGIVRIFNQPQNQRAFDQYFQSSYYLAEFPLESRYNVSIEMGLHFAYRFSEEIKAFIDFNSVRLRYEQAFTVAVDNPNKPTVEPDYVQFPVIGEENRFYLNTGIQASYYYEEGLNAYFSFLVNINDVELDRNYIVIDNRQYEILHPVDGDFNRRPGGVGYGGGIGTGVNFKLGSNLLTDLYYNLYYIKTYLRKDLQPFGTQHSVGLRLAWLINGRN